MGEDFVIRLKYLEIVGSKDGSSVNFENHPIPLYFQDNIFQVIKKLVRYTYFFCIENNKQDMLAEYLKEVRHFVGEYLFDENLCKDLANKILTQIYKYPNSLHYIFTEDD